MLKIKEILVKKNYQWEVLTNVNTTLGVLLNEYNETYIKVLDDTTAILRQYNLHDFTNIKLAPKTASLEIYVRNFNHPFPDHLNPTKEIQSPAYIRFNSVWKYGFDVTRGNHVDVTLGTNFYKPDLAITYANESNADLIYRIRNFMYTVNGLVFFDKVVGNVVYLPRAGLASGYYNDKQYGVLDFSEFGGVTKQLCTSQNTIVFSSTDDETVVHITTTEPIQDKTIMMVINGRLYPTPDRFTVIGSNKVAFRIIHSQVVNELVNIPKSDIDWLSGIKLGSGGWRLSTFDPIGYISQGNSGLLIIDNKDLSVKDLPLPTPVFPGRYCLSPKLPRDAVLFLSDGTIGEYNITSVNDYSIEMSCTSFKIRDALKDTTLFSELSGVNTVTLAFASAPTPAKYRLLYRL